MDKSAGGTGPETGRGRTPDGRWIADTFPVAPNTMATGPGAFAPDVGAGINGARHREEILPEYGHGSREFLKFSSDLRVMLCDFEYFDEARGQADGLDMLKFHFKISGRNRICFEGQDEIMLTTGTSAVAFHPKGMMKDDWYGSKARESSLTLSCSPAHMIEALRLDPEDLPRPIRRFLEDGTPDFFFRGLPLTNRMVRVIEDILTPPYAPQLRRMHAEARSLDLVCMSLDMMMNADDVAEDQPRLKARDVEALHGVKQYLDTVFADCPKIQELSRRFGINRTKLNTGFKALFGETVFDYVQRLRMEYAVSLLRETDMSIGLIANAVGYEHQSSFSSAFVSAYGYTPVQLRKQYRRSV